MARMLCRYKIDLRFLNNNCIFATIIRPQTETKISHSYNVCKFYQELVNQQKVFLSRNYSCHQQTRSIKRNSISCRKAIQESIVRIAFSASEFIFRDLFCASK
mmetsp:Transcript_1769/g.1991  ORF Transcript_1769/g.1991 Transcript_1769/m.1991 type:complete len:103 (+) Transcript_1769:1831-2139(+)